MRDENKVKMMTERIQIWKVAGRALCAACVFASMLSVLSSCHRRPLEDPEYLTRVNVEVNVDDIKNVTCDIYNPAVQVPEISPDVMHVIFFDKNGSVAAETFITDVSVAENGHRVLSGEFSVIPGKYRMLIYDYGTEATLIKDFYSWDNATAYTDPVPAYIQNTWSKGSDGSPEIFTQPDHLMVARNAEESIPYHYGMHTVYAEAKPVVESWYIQIKVDGLEYVSGAQAVLSGMARANKFATDTRVEKPESALWFKMEKSEDGGAPVICAVFNTFGHVDGDESGLDVTFSITTSDGRKVRHSFDISGLFRTENAVRHHWLLLEDTIKIDPPKTSGGYNPEVGDWDEEHRDIDI